MTPQQLVGTGVRLFAIWLLITSFPYLSTIPSELAQNPVGPEHAGAVARLLGVGYAGVALLLWFFPMAAAHKLVPRTHHTDTLTLKADELARVGCALLGLWLATRALPDVAWLLFRAFLSSGSTYSVLQPEDKLNIAVAATQLAFAVVLVAKANTLARWVSWTPSAREE